MILGSLFLLQAAAAISAAAGNTESSASASGGSDLDTVTARLIRQMVSAGAGDCKDAQHCASSLPAAPAAARRDAAALTVAGSWPDVNYSDTTRTGGWSPHLHLDRMVNLAAVVRAANGSSAVEAVEAAALIGPTTQAIKFWLQTDPRSDNWWWDDLRVPWRVASTALLFQPWLDVELEAQMVMVMERADYSKRTGANLDDEVATAIARGALLRNATLVGVGFARLWQEIRVVPPTDPACLDPPHGTQGCATDGIQADASFHQHGPELLAGSYGEGYVRDSLKFMGLSAGTAFAPTPAQSGLFASLLLDGMQLMAFGSPACWDWSVKGRDMGTSMRVLRTSLNTSLFAAVQTARHQELAAFARAIDGSTSAEAAQPRGHRAYWASDYAVIHSVSLEGNPWMASVHMHSLRTVSARCVNGQGSMNEHTGDGMVYTYIGLEHSQYNQAFQSWDWRRLPAITAAVDSPMLPCNYSDQLLADSSLMNATGSVSDGHAGLSAMRLVSHGATAAKAVAMLGHGLVHLVAGARCVRAGQQCGELVTTFENNIARGAVHLMCNGSAVTVLGAALREPHRGCNWAWHNGTGYLLPRSQTVLVTNGAERSTPPKTGPGEPQALFSLAVSHGGGRGGRGGQVPATSWVALPGVSLATMMGSSGSGGSIISGRGNVTIAANDEGIQAVWAPPRLLAVVWQAGAQQSLDLQPDQALGLTSVQADRPVVLLVQQSSSCGSFTVTVSDPSNNPAGGKLVLQLAGIAGATVCSTPPCPCSTAGETTTVTLALPAGQSAGSSTNVTCIPHACTTARQRAK